MKPKISKKGIRVTLDKAINQALVELDIANPSKRTSKLIDRSLKKLSETFKDDIKALFKKELKAKRSLEKKNKSEKKVA